jgi:hypothetical protein
VRASDDAGVANDQPSQACLGITHGLHGHDDFVVNPIEAKGDDFEEQGLFADEVMVEAGLGHAQGTRNIADRCRVKSPDAKNLGGRPADFRAPGVEAYVRPVPGRHLVGHSL